jgi:hypothetical protein
MEEKLISFETAKLAKEKGFNIPQAKGYYKHMDTQIVLWIDPKDQDDFIAFAPTQALLQKWLREVHTIDCTPAYTSTNEKTLCYDSMVYSDLFPDEELEDIDLDSEKTYEEALEEGLLTALKLIPTCTK